MDTTHSLQESNIGAFFQTCKVCTALFSSTFYKIISRFLLLNVYVFIWQHFASECNVLVGGGRGDWMMGIGSEWAPN